MLSPVHYNIAEVNQCKSDSCHLCPPMRSNQLEVLDVLEGKVHSISLPIKLKSVFLVAEDRWLLLESNTNK